MSLGRRVAKLEAVLTPAGAHGGTAAWWAHVPPIVVAYLAAQEPAVAAAFSAHLAWMQALPGNRDGFRYYQTFTRPWRAGEGRFVAPALLVWDAVFRTGGRPTLCAAQLAVLACGLDNLRAALADEGLDAGAARSAAWARLAGGPLCAHRDCLCFHGRGFACRDPAVPVAAWRTRGTRDAATPALLGFGEPELALLAADEEEGDHAA